MCLLVSGSMYSLARPKSTINITLSFFMLVLEIQIKWLRKLTWICELLHKKKKAQPADEEILRLDVSVGEEQKVIDAL